MPSNAHLLPELLQDGCSVCITRGHRMLAVDSHEHAADVAHVVIVGQDDQLLRRLGAFPYSVPDLVEAPYPGGRRIGQ